MLARVLAAPRAQLGFVAALLPEGRLQAYTFKCTRRLALRTVSTSTPSRHSSYVFEAKPPEHGDSQAVLKLAFNDKELLPPNANCVRLLAAGRFNHSRTLWQAVLVEPVVKPLKARLSVQQIAQVTSDIADAMEQLAELDCTSGHLAKQRRLPGGHGCHGWLYDLVLQRWVWDGPDLGHYVVSPEDLLCTDLQTYEAGTYLTGTPMYMAIDVLRGSSHSPSTDMESLFYTILAVCDEWTSQRSWCQIC
eukprot:jgi/Astpho2/2611/Aster-04314